ncbi:MAG: carbohydrate kinase [Candidatus Omnitrophica bacterium]|nr:carbohydrate kinase [Candidatus Omnitrophota bacterium]
MMDKNRLQEILSRFPERRILIVGDFFLDRYLMIDPALDEISIETGKTAYQVVGRRPQPGAAGTVCNNLHALKVGALIALTVIGDDGEGYELRKALSRRGVSIDHIVVREDRFTPTYTKPMRLTPEGEVEMNREDAKNRQPLPADLEDELIQRLQSLAPQADAIIVADQVQERNCGVITDRMRDAVAETARKNPRKIFFADSRERIGEFRDVIIKPNRFEAVKAVHSDIVDDPSTELAKKCADALRARTGKPVFLTLDKEGVCPVSEEGQYPVPCPPVDGPIDIVGAGDSTTAGIVSALASGASLAEAAVIGNLTASVTIRQLGTTGTASPQQVMEAWSRNESLYQNIG